METLMEPSKMFNEITNDPLQCIRLCVSFLERSRVIKLTENCINSFCKKTCSHSVLYQVSSSQMKHYLHLNQFNRSKIIFGKNMRERITCTDSTAKRNAFGWEYMVALFYSMLESWNSIGIKEKRIFPPKKKCPKSSKINKNEWVEHVLGSCR